MPEGYQGVVVREGGGEETEKADKGEAAEDELEEGDEAMEEEEEVVKALDEVARFEVLVVWEHETVPEDDDVFVKGVEEWIKFAEAVSFSSFSVFFLEQGQSKAYISIY